MESILGDLMKTIWTGLVLSATLIVSVTAFAATYSVTGSCIDPTPTVAWYTPAYDWEVRVNGVASVPTNELSRRRAICDCHP